jgi:hypothetical protein
MNVCFGPNFTRAVLTDSINVEFRHKSRNSINALTLDVCQIKIHEKRRISERYVPVERTKICAVK